MNKNFVVGIDVDDTLWNLTIPWVEALNERYGLSVKSENITDWDICRFFPSLTREQVFGILDEEGFWQRLKPAEFSVWFLEQLIKDGYKIKIITSSHWKNIKQKVERFLEVFPMLAWKDVTVTTDKPSVRVNVLIDDAPHNLEGGDYHKILMSRPHNLSYGNTIDRMYRVRNLDEAYKIIKKISTSGVLK
jgi:5'(3')-deoxyribonucleotidase